jgi:DNA-directed RNA polymerase alpha subunit
LPELESTKTITGADTRKDLVHAKIEDENNKKTIMKQNERIAQLEKLIEKLKLKEESENKALEQMIRNVEENLRVTTERALDLETLVEKQRHELKIIKAENFSLKKFKENCEFRLNKIAKTLAEGANLIETDYKQVLKNVDWLRTTSSSLESFTKFEE